MKQTLLPRLLILGLLVGTLRGYAPPIGIPDPAGFFGTFNPIDTPKPTTATYAPGWPSRANSIAAGDAHDCYYIDNSHGAATDTSNPFGYPNKPRLTIPEVVYSAGAYVEIRGGGAPYTVPLRPAGVGTAAAPIWFVGVGSPVISARCDIGNDDRPLISFLVFDGLEFRNGSSIDIRPRFLNNAIRNIVLRNCKVIGTATNMGGGPGVGVGTSALDRPSQSVENVVLHNCEVSHFGNKTAPNEECGVYPSFHVTNLWFLDGSVHDCAEDGFGGSHGGKRTATGFYIGRTQIYNNVTNGIDLKHMGKVVISQCEVYNHFASTPNSSGEGENIVVHYSGGSTPGPLAEADTYKDWPEDVSVLFCRIHHGDFGVVLSSVDRFRAVGNIFHDIRHSMATNSDGILWTGNSPFDAGAAIHMRGVLMDTYITHNTIYGCDAGIQYPEQLDAYSPTKAYFRGNPVFDNANPDPSLRKAYTFIGNDSHPAGVTGAPLTDTSVWQPFNIHIWGNIISHRSAPTGRDIYVSSGTIGNIVLKLDYNLIYAPAGAAYSYGGSSIVNLAFVRANSPHLANTLEADPSYTNASGLDFSLLATSPAVDNGSEGTGVTAYADYLSRMGVNIKVDFTGSTVRPRDGGWDMGALESALLPPAPSGLLVTP